MFDGSTGGNPPNPLGKKKEPPKDNKEWHHQQELILKNWGEVSACYRYMHYKSYQKFKAMSMRFTLPIIIISTVTGTANFAQETFPDEWRGYVPLCIGALNLFAAILTTVLQFLKANELLESHRVSSISYGKLARDITLELSLPIKERNYGGGVMVEKSRSEYDRLIEQSPPVPKDVLKKFDRKFPVSKQKAGEAFTRPEILSINVIKPFDSAKEQQLTTGVASIFKSKLANQKRNMVQEKVKEIQENKRKERIADVSTKAAVIAAQENTDAVTSSTIASRNSVIEEIEALKGRSIVSALKKISPKVTAVPPNTNDETEEAILKDSIEKITEQPTEKIEVVINEPPPEDEEDDGDDGEEEERDEGVGKL